MSKAPSLSTLQALIPDYARDLSVNLSVLADEETLSPQQKWGTFLACAHAGGAVPVIQAFEGEAHQRLSAEAIRAAKAAAAITRMNGVYFRALHLMKNKDYQAMRSGLRMGILSHPEVDKVDFELWAMAVSALQACGLCMDSHEKALREHGVSLLKIQAVIRIAAVIHAVSSVLRAENAVQAGQALP